MPETTNTTISSNKRIAKNTMFLYFRMLLTMLVSLYTSRVVLHTLGVGDFGIYNVVGGIIVMFGFLNASMSEATSRFLTFELGRQDFDRLRKTFSAALTIHLLIAAIIVLLGETAGLWWLENKLVIATDRMNAARWVFHLSVISSAIAITQVPYNATIIAHERMNVYAYIEILNSLLKLGIVFLLVACDFDKLILYAILTLCVAIVITVTYRLYCMRHFSESHYTSEWNKKIIIPMLGFSGWNLYQTSSFTLKTQGVNMVLNLFYGTVLNAAYGLATQVQSAVTSFSSNFLTAVRPQIIKYYAIGDIAKMQNLVINASKFSFILLLVLAFPLIIENQFIMQIWLTKVPDYTVVFSQLFLMYSIIEGSGNPLTTVIQATGKIKPWCLTVGTLFIMVVPITYWLFSLGFSPIVPMVANVIMITIVAIFRVFLVKHLIPKFSLTKYIVRFGLVITAIVLLSAVIPLYLRYSLNEGFLRFTLICGSFVFVLSVATYYIALNRQMRKKLVFKINNKLNSITLFKYLKLNNDSNE